jgi:hypothetical protein
MDLTVDKINKIKINFVIGMERTGSSMLSAMFNKSDQILSTSEEPFALYLYKKYEKKQTYTRQEIDTLVDEFWITSEKNLKLFYDTKENLKNSLYGFLPNIDFQLLCKIIYLNFHPLKDKSQVEVIIDKQLKYINYIPLIQEIFPKAKILILTRNHKDVITSWKKRKLGLNQNVAYLAKVYNINYSNAKKSLDLKLENMSYTRYEDLVSEPGNTLEQICNFFEISFHENMIEHHTQYNALIEKMADKIEDKFIDHILDFHSNTMKPISKDLINEWKNVLTEKEIGVAEKINNEIDLLFNYSQVSKNYSYNFDDRLNIFKAIIERKIYHPFYFKSPLWLKIILKKSKQFFLK